MPTIHARSLDGYQVDITAGNHRFTMDEPITIGGTDTGPNPYDALLAALAACKIITCRMYADRKEWPLDDVYVELSHGSIYAKDCADCESEGGKIDEITVSIEFVGDLTDEQRARLKDISTRCPVHKTLTTETIIRTT